MNRVILASLEQQVVDKLEFMEENDRIWGKKVVVDAGDSQNLKAGTDCHCPQVA